MLCDYECPSLVFHDLGVTPSFPCLSLPPPSLPSSLSHIVPGILSGSSISDSDPDQGVDDDTTLATADPSYQLRHALFSSEASEDTDHWLVSDSDKEPDEPLPFLSNAEVRPMQLHNSPFRFPSRDKFDLHPLRFANRMRRHTQNFCCTLSCCLSCLLTPCKYAL